MTPAPQPQEYIITEEQIVKIGEAMTKWYLPDAAGSLCFLLRSRPAPQPQGKLVYSSAPWKIYEQDAGMGERDYAVMLNDVFFCRTDDSQTAMRIVEAIRSRPHAPAPCPQHKIWQHCPVAATIRNATLTDVIAILNERAMIDENNQYYFWLEDVELTIESLRTKEHP